MLDPNTPNAHERVKAAGAIWRPRPKRRELDWKTAREFGLQKRVVEEKLDQVLYISRYAHADVYIFLSIVAYTNICV